jgi:periplasmic protein TonB
MFKVLNGQKRRVISPATVVASIAAHILLLGGAVYAAASDTGPREEVGGIVELPPLPTEPPAPEPVEPAPPPPAPEQPTPPDAPEPVPGEVLQLETPTQAPRVLLPEPPGVVPVDPEDYRRDGKIGDVIGPPTVAPTPPSGNTNPPAGGGDEYILDEGMVEERPSLNRDGLGRTLERYYPAVLRDSRVGGRVVIELIVDENGRVRDNSARVVEASHPAFGDAALRAVERFRFRPAKMGGVPVPVRVTIPINWTVPE